MYVFCEDTEECAFSYKSYLKTRHWKNVKKRYKKSKLIQDCYVCGKKDNLSLHHKTYKRIGKERLTDFIPLCKNCHEVVHAIVTQKNPEKTTSWSVAKYIRKKYKKTGKLPPVNIQKERRKKYEKKTEYKEGKTDFVTNNGVGISIKKWFLDKNKEQAQLMANEPKLVITYWTDNALQFNKKYWVPKSVMEFTG